MNRIVKRATFIVTLIVILAIAGSMIVHQRQSESAVRDENGASSSNQMPKDGSQVPLFSLPSIAGHQTVSLSAYRGKPLFINFWASWCGPCQQETPDVVKAYATYGKKVAFIGVNLTSEDTVKDAEAFMKKYHIPYQVLTDSAGNVANQYAIVGIPTSVFVNRNGMITATYVGSIPMKTLLTDLSKIA